MNRLILFLTIALAVAAEARAGEIVHVWNQKSSYNRIWDMKFLPDNNYFIISTDSTLEIRSTDTGDSVIAYKKQLFYYCYFDITPDSTKLVLINGPKIELRNLTDMSIIAEDSLLAEFPNIGKDFIQLAIDPVRPLAYCVVMNIAEWSSDIYKNRKIVVYNYNTMKQQSILPGSENQYWELMAISKDGKYLAAITDQKSKLVVWSLETMEIIRELWLIDPYLYTEDVITSLGCIKFSEKDTDKIYYSGTFPQTADDLNNDGLFVYSIESNRIIDSTFGIGEKRLASSRFCFFDNESRLLNVNQTYITVLNLIKNKIEYHKNQDYDGIKKISQSIYSIKKNSFVSAYLPYIKEFQYDPFIGIIETDSTIQTVYPNPTTNSVIIALHCEYSNQYYDIFDGAGNTLLKNQTIQPGSSDLHIDFSPYPDGAYFVRIFCNGTFSTFKIIKKG